MLITRKFGSLIRGNATPFQIGSASILGMLLGFIPGFQQAPGLIVLWTLGLIILNANLFLAGLAGILAKLIFLVAAPVVFALGRFLLEGPAGSLFQNLANGPVTAYFGFDYYVVPGGQLLGLVCGALLGLALISALGAYRRKMTQLEGNSEAYQKWSSKGWVKALTFLFLGKGKGKRSYEELLSKKWGNPIRVPGLILAIAILAGGYFGINVVSDSYVTATLKQELENANGATVDLENVHIDLQEGQVELTGLALADPEALGSNLFASDRIVADISAADILKKRFSIDSLVFENASAGLPRSSEGKIVGDPSQRVSTPSLELPDYQDLGSVLNNAPEWQERLSQAKQWLESLGGEGGDPEEDSDSLKKTLAQRIQELGYTGVTKLDMIEGSPTLWIRNLVAKQVKTSYLENATLDIMADNLSSDPSLVPQDPSIRITSSDGSLEAALALGAAAGRADNQLSLKMTGLSVDDLAATLKSAAASLSGGTMAIDVSGKLSSIDSDLKILTRFQGTTLSLGGSSTSADNLNLPLFVRGPIDNPRIRLDSKALRDAVVDAGKKELLNKAAEELSIEGVDTKDGESIEDAAKGLLKGFLRKKIEE